MGESCLLLLSRCTKLSLKELEAVIPFADQLIDEWCDCVGCRSVVASLLMLIFRDKMDYATEYVTFTALRCCTSSAQNVQLDSFYIYDKPLVAISQRPVINVKAGICA